jgi:hypothetical protein
VYRLRQSGAVEAVAKLSPIGLPFVGLPGILRVFLGVSMRSNSSSWLVLSLAVCISCGGNGGDPKPVAPVVLSRTDPEPAGEHCAAGGQAVRSGIDANQDGVLQDQEVTTVQYLCAAPARTLLVRTREETAGANCTTGGKAVLSGVDQNGDGTLSDDEVAQTTYVCAEAQPQVLTKTTPVQEGTSGCLNGGTRVQAGPDANRNGTLEQDEIQQDQVVCGANVLVTVGGAFVSKAEGCLWGGGTLVRTGPDLDGDGVLSDAEVTQKSYVCATTTYGYTVRDQADLDYLHDQVDLVRGDLIIESTSLSSVFLPPIVVTGAVRARDCPALTELSVVASIVGSDIEVARTPELTYFGASMDPTLWGLQPMPILGNLTITDAPKLARIDIGEVPYVQGSVVLRRVGVTDLDAVNASDLWQSGLQWIGGDLQLEDCDQLTGLDSAVSLGELSRIGGSLILRGNDALEQWSGTPHLERVGDVFVDDNASLTDLRLDSLTTVERSIRVRNNAKLRDLSHHLLASVGADYVVSDNAALEANGHLPRDVSLLAVDGAIRIERNASLRSLFGLAALGRAGGGISIADNGALTYLSMERLQWTPGISIVRNAALPYLGYSGYRILDADNLTSLRSCTYFEVRENPSLVRLDLPALVDVGQLEVTANAALPTCQAQALAAQAHSTSTTITGNFDAGTCP